MHIQGVYETKVSTETFNSVDQYIGAKTEFSNAQTGSSSFRATSYGMSYEYFIQVEFRWNFFFILRGQLLRIF